MLLAGAPVLAGACADDAPRPERPPRGARDDDREEETESWRDELAAIGYADFAEPEESEDPGADEEPVALDPGRVAPGYTLITSIPHSVADLVDRDGRVVHSWSGADAAYWDRAELDAEGRLVVIEVPPEGDEKLTPFTDIWVTCLAWDGTRLWRTPVSAHHDLDIAADGRVLVLGRQLLPLREGVDVIDDTAVFLSRDGEVEKTVSLIDVLRPDPTVGRSIRRIFAAYVPEPHPKDFLHANAIQWMPWPELAGTRETHREGAVLVTLRHRNGLAIFDGETEEVLWSWGGRDLVLPHEATWTRGGHVLVFDNGSAERPWSRILEVDPATDEILWEYVAEPPSDFYCKARGTSQELSNGNVLVADSDSGVVFEITREGETVWRYRNQRMTDGLRGTVRAIRYEPARIERFLAD